MNANKISPKANARLNQIKIVSRIAKFFALAFLAFMTIQFSRVILSSWPSFHSPNPEPSFLCYQAGLFLYQVVLAVWYWKLSRLFRFYERGLIFATETIRCIKTLGLLFIIGWMLNSILRLLPKESPAPLPQGVTQTIDHIYHMGFFTFDFGTPIDLGMLLSGTIIILIAWIMDEGRKIQEEQELTV